MKNPGIRLEEYIREDLQSLYKDTKRRPGSGNVHGDGDVTAGPFEIECKDRPTQRSISIAQKDWKRTIEAARRAGCKIPAFINRNLNGIFVTLRWEDLLIILRELADFTKHEGDDL